MNFSFQSNPKTAHILVRESKLAKTYRRILVRKGEYYHTDLHQWLTLPEEWQALAEEALAAVQSV